MGKGLNNDDDDDESLPLLNRQILHVMLFPTLWLGSFMFLKMGCYSSSSLQKDATSWLQLC